MTELDLARQLVTYVDATTEPAAPAVDRPVEVVVLEPPADPPSRRWLIAVAAVAVLLLMGALALAGIRGEDAVEELDDETVSSTTVPARLASAIATAERYFEAWSTNDDETVRELQSPDAADPDRERNLIRWWFLTGSGGEDMIWPSAPCEVAPAGDQPDGVRVECPIRIGDPVARALGLDELTWAATVGDDGVVRRDAEPVADGRRSVVPVWQVYSDYLADYLPTQPGCDPDDREPGTVVVQAGLPLDALCAQVAVQIADAVALWVEHLDAAPELSASALRGVWENTSGFAGLVVHFRDGDTFSIGNAGRLDDAGAFTWGTYSLDGDVLRFVTSPDAGECADATWTWRVAMPIDGLLEVDVAAGPCSETAHWRWARISPSSPAGSSITPEVAPGELREPVGVVAGVWHRVGAGDVLVVSRSGEYALTDDGDLARPVDRGSVVSARPGEWVFTSDGGGACPAGTSWVWQEVRVPVGAGDRPPTAPFVADEIAAPLCGIDGAPSTWRRVSPLAR